MIWWQKLKWEAFMWKHLVLASWRLASGGLYPMRDAPDELIEALCELNPKHENDPDAQLIFKTAVAERKTREIHRSRNA
jgi:hypothetical protein